jgi:hypothetical protein
MKMNIDESIPTWILAGYLLCGTWYAARLIRFVVRRINRRDDPHFAQLLLMRMRLPPDLP